VGAAWCPTHLPLFDHPLLITWLTVDSVMRWRSPRRHGTFAVVRIRPVVGAQITVELAYRREQFARFVGRLERSKSMMMPSIVVRARKTLPCQRPVDCTNIHERRSLSTGPGGIRLGMFDIAIHVFHVRLNLLAQAFLRLLARTGTGATCCQMDSTAPG